MRRSIPAIAMALVAGACTSGNGAATAVTAATTPATTTPAPTTTAPSSTTTVTTEPPYVAVEVRAGEDADPEVVALLGDLYTWLADRDAPRPDLPEGLAAHIASLESPGPGLLEADVFTAQVKRHGWAGVAIVEGQDIVLMVNDRHPSGSGYMGWRTVGGWFAREGADPWFGPTIRRVMIIGTDARDWQDPIRFRGDSLHIVTANTESGGGGILGFPRDSWIEAPWGTDKFTHVNAITWTRSDKQVEGDLATIGSDPYLSAMAQWRGLDAVAEYIRHGPDGGETTTQIAEDLAGIDIEGYILTGFRDFQLLLNDYGGIVVDVPFAMADASSQAYFEAGPQDMWGRFALAFSRNRHIRGGDFTRSLHQGLVILARLTALQDGDFSQLPTLISGLGAHTWTDLSLEDLLTLGASAYLIDPAKVGNAVVPGSVATRGGASVVVISDNAEPYYRDLDDGVLDLDFLDDE